MATTVRVLILENRPADAELLVRELRRGGFDPQWMRVEEEGAFIAALAEMVPDVILADCTMPRYNALLALQAMQQSGLDIPFIVISGADSEETAVAAVRAGASDYIMKSNLTRLAIAVDRQLREAEVRKQAGEQLERQQVALTTLYASAQKLSQSLNQQQLAQYVVETSVRVLGADVAWLGRAEDDGSIQVLRHFPPDTPALAGLEARWDRSPAGDQPSGRAVRTGRAVVMPDVSLEPTFYEQRRVLIQKAGLRGIAAIPLIARDRPVGILTLWTSGDAFFDPPRVEFLQAFGYLAGAALENARLFAEVERRLGQLEAIRNIDIAISGSLDLRVMLDVLLDRVTGQLHVDAASVLLLDPHEKTLRCITSRGFRTAALKHTRLTMGRGHAGRAAFERRTVTVPILPQEPGEFSRSPEFAMEGFIGYCATPFVAKGEVKGVLEIFHRAPLRLDADRLAFLETLASQAAIAIDNATLFEDLRRSHSALTLAYDATIEGWSRALDLRDKETEGHTQRVTELTVRLARMMGVPDADLVYVRWGALLHDIGKMGIPDSILLKPGPLSAEEWDTMKRHPVYAHELLSPIPYLRPALAIPLSHHERWDGTGYPRGLPGDQIPLEARTFAVADVWDALTSERPYREAWSEAKALEYIREQAGKQFDPQVVEAFLGLEDIAAIAAAGNSMGQPAT